MQFLPLDDGQVEKSCNLCGHLQSCQMPDIENSRKTSRKGCRVGPRKTAKTPEKQPKQLFFGCFGCFFGCFIRNVSGDPNPQYFSKSTAVQMGGVLPYKWEAYCSTNGRCIAGFPFLRSLEARKARRYKWGACCRTNWRCTAVLLGQVVGVGVSETLPIFGCFQCRAYGSSVDGRRDCKRSRHFTVITTFGV